MTAIKKTMRTWHTPFINIDEMTKKQTKTKESKRKRKMGSASI